MPTLPKIATSAIVLQAAGYPEEAFANGICKATGMPSGTVVPALNRLADRDGVFSKHEEATTTGRPRVFYVLTDAGRALTRELLEAFAPRVQILARGDADVLGQRPKVNTSTLWLLADATAAGDAGTIGYRDTMRPLTHQAAYVELGRMTELGWLERRGDRHHLGPLGRRVAATVVAEWQPRLGAAERSLT